MSDLPPPPPPPGGDQPYDRPAGRVLPYPAFPPTQRDELPSQGPGSPVPILLRIGGWIIDYVVISIVGYLFVAVGPLNVITPSGKNATPRLDGPAWAKVLLALIPVLFTFLFFLWRGETPGMMALRMRLCRYLDAGQPNAQQCLVRALLPWAPILIASAVPAIGIIGELLTAAIYFSAAFDQLYRGLQDKAAGTIVLRTR
jgi:uncharacterized RDD family membrane protein YckC